LNYVAVIPGVKGDIVAALMVSQHRKERDFSPSTPPERDNSKPEECNPYRETLKTQFKIPNYKELFMEAAEIRLISM